MANEIIKDSELNSVSTQKSIEYDDAYEMEKYLKKRTEQIEADKKKPFDPDALLEVRHLRKTFPIKKKHSINYEKRWTDISDYIES